MHASEISRTYVVLSWDPPAPRGREPLTYFVEKVPRPPSPRACGRSEVEGLLRRPEGSSGQSHRAAVAHGGAGGAPRGRAVCNEPTSRQPHCPASGVAPSARAMSPVPESLLSTWAPGRGNLSPRDQGGAAGPLLLLTACPYAAWPPGGDVVEQFPLQVAGLAWPAAGPQVWTRVGR